MTEHPINPSPELVQHWIDQSFRAINRYRSIATLAAQWGADTELEACCMEIIDGEGLFHIDKTSDRVDLADGLRAARRKSPSLKKQALQELNKVDMLWATEEFGQKTLNSLDTIRKALKALADD